MIRVQLDETVGGGNSRGLFAVFVMGVANLKLRLLRIASVRITGFQLFE